jgi:hypothetical protein
MVTRVYCFGNKWLITKWLCPLSRVQRSNGHQLNTKCSQNMNSQWLHPLWIPSSNWQQLKHEMFHEVPKTWTHSGSAPYGRFKPVLDGSHFLWEPPVPVKGIRFKYQTGSLDFYFFDRRELKEVSVFSKCINLSDFPRNGFQKCEHCQFSDGGSLWLDMKILFLFYNIIF